MKWQDAIRRAILVERLRLLQLTLSISPKYHSGIFYSMSINPNIIRGFCFFYLPFILATITGLLRTSQMGKITHRQVSNSACWSVLNWSNLLFCCSLNLSNALCCAAIGIAAAIKIPINTLFRIYLVIFYSIHFHSHHHRILNVTAGCQSSFYIAFTRIAKSSSVGM